jgi:monovalent cation/proton antiporter MnhG/PhaG subunit
MDLIEQCYNYLFWGALVVLAVGILAALVYIIRARLTVDRIIGINLVGTIVVMVIVVLTFLLGEDYLADIALIYVVLSFIAVMMLCRIYINLYQRNQRKKEEASHEWIRFGVTALCVVGGLFALLTALLGLFRFDYALNRLHAAAIADTLALGLVLLGVMVAVGFRAVLWKLVLVLVIQWYTSPLSSHMLAQFEYRAGQEDLARYLELPEETEEVSAP